MFFAISYSGKLNQSDKHFVRLRLLKGVYASYESFFDIYLFELNTITSMAKYLFKISNSNTSKKPLTAKIDCSMLTIKTQNQDVKSILSAFIVNFEYISRLVLVFLLLTLNN